MSTRTTLHEQITHAHIVGREAFEVGLTLARQAEDEAATTDDAVSVARALALQGKLLLAHGLMEDACTLATRVELRSREDGDVRAIVAVATFHAQLAFYLGGYRDAIGLANRAIAAADASGDPGLRASARAGTCIVLGNLGAPNVHDVMCERLSLSQERGDQWDEAMARNDLATGHLERDDLAAALTEIERAESVAACLDGPLLTLRSVIQATRAQIMLAGGAYTDAADCAVQTVQLLDRSPRPHPYIFGMAVIIAVQALAKAGRVDEANAQGQRGIDRLGELLPLMRGGIQASLAEGLRQAGRMEEAYEALAASVTLERQAAQQFAALQHDLAEAARERETALQEAARLRDEADRDWLTGLHNRRFLARLPLSGESTVGIALVDLDDFKAVNDTFGHEFGDRVLARVAQLLVAVARADDTVVRLGGDEFVVVMAGADRERALACAHRLQAALADEPWDTMDATLRVGASVGFTAGPSSTPLETLISQADRYLYRAKESGRGHVAGELDAL